MLSKIRFLTVCVIAALIFVGVAGCNRGPKTIKVQGTITINGEPAEGIHVEFHPQPTGRYGLGITDKNGDYEVQFTRSQKGALPGPNIIRIMAYRNPEDDSSQYLPSEYNSGAEENAELNVEVSRDNYEFDFNVEMDAGELAEHQSNSGVPEEE
jgi:hypothetical protein